MSELESFMKDMGKVVDAFMEALEAFGLQTANTDPLRLSNNWVDRAYWAWNWDTFSDHIDDGWGQS